MKILVTGATGFLGNNLVRALLRDQHEITASVRQASDPRPLNGLELDRLSLDLNDAAAVSSAVNQADLVIHAAAMVHIGWTKLDASRQVNVGSTRLLAEAARRQGIRMIHVSSVDTLASSDGESLVDETQPEPAKPACAYVVSKRESELAVLEEVDRGLDAVIVNPGFMIGPWDWKPSSGKMMLSLKKIPILYFAPGGGCTVVDVRDVADGIVSAIKHGRSGEKYILGGKNVTYLELWQMMAQAMNKRPPVRGMSSRLAGLVGRLGDFASRFSRQELEVNSASVELGQLFHWYTSQKAETELGYRIGDVENATKDAWDWFKSYKYV
jgi:dihydroflavonol-4-reductase